MEVSEQWVWQASQSSRKCFLGRCAVHTHAQYLGIFLLEPAVFDPEPGALVCSTTCEGEDVSLQYNDFFAPILAQCNFLSFV